MKANGLIICALFAAIIAISAPLCVPVGTVPVTLGLFSVALTAFFVGSKKALFATGVYVLAGLAGLPVFSGFQGGFGVIIGPTGGFIFSYILVAAILGQCLKTKNKGSVIGLCALALVVCYVCGTSWYMLVTKSNIITALMLCVVPFIAFDIIKLYMAYIAAKAIRKRVKLKEEN